MFLLFRSTVAAVLLIFAEALMNKTNSEFHCTDKSSIALRQVCNGIMDCADGSDEVKALCTFITCPSSSFQCNYGACIQKSLTCDGKIDCADGSDESHCGHESGRCNKTEFQCGSGECVDHRLLCNGKTDCMDKSDESPTICLDFPCPRHAFHCELGGCISQTAKCDGVEDCPDGSDEFQSHCSQNCSSNDKKSCTKRKVCAINELRCHSGQCVPRQAFCDGRLDCSDGSDEMLTVCSKTFCPMSMFRCKYGGCISISLICNGEPQCADWSDEDPQLCGLTIATGSCYLPALSPYAHYAVTDCPTCQPGAVVAEYQELKYSCEVGHSLQGNASVYCQNSSWVPQLPTCIRANRDVTCPPVSSPHLSVTCESHWGNRRGWVPCDNPVTVGTIARYQCQEYYIPNAEEHESNTFSECQKDGTWSTDFLQCVPECGKIREEVIPLVVNGQEAKYGVWPWQAGLFFLQAGNWTFWCGGSLISEYVVLTAAHCTWKVNENTLQVVLGKFYRDFDMNQELTQVKDVKQIIMQPAYQDQSGNYGSDLAVLVLASPVEFSPAVQPVCIDWDLRAIDNDLREGNLGTVAGWGLNENDTFSDTLHTVQLSVVSDEKCIKEQPRAFRKYVTYTTFCAGYRNRTGVCNGDSGGGLIFPQGHGPNSTWLLQGIVSVSPRRRGTAFCDSTYYTVFTKVGIYNTWLKRVLESVQPHYVKPKGKEPEAHYRLLYGN